jgi:hypothetical protein
MRNGVSAACAGAFLCTAAAPADTSAEYRVHAAPVQLALPNSGAEGTRTHGVGDYVLDVPLLWEEAGTLREPVRVEVDGAVQEFAAGTVLPLHLIGPAKGDPVRAFCTPRRAAERAFERGTMSFLFGPQSALRGAVRRANDRQTCMIDSDADGRVDSSVILGDGPPEARRPRPLAPAAVDRSENQPIGNEDRLRLKLTRLDRRGRWAEFELEIQQQGRLRAFDLLAGEWGSSNRISRVPADSEGVLHGDIAGTVFSVLAVDGAARSAQIRWSTKPARNLVVAIPESVQIVRR